MAIEKLVIRGAREHNLKDISLDLPRDALIVFTGLSGSGKSSLAFDTIFAEGQRRYVESLSAYARQFLGQMDKPDVDFIEGLSPAVSIDQNLPIEIRAQLLEQSPRYMTTCVCSSHGLEGHIVRNAQNRSPVKARNKLWIRFLNYPQRQSFKCSLPLFENVKVSLSISLLIL